MGERVGWDVRVFIGAGMIVGMRVRDTEAVSVGMGRCVAVGGVSAGVGVRPGGRPPATNKQTAPPVTPVEV